MTDLRGLLDVEDVQDIGDSCWMFRSSELLGVKHGQVVGELCLRYCVLRELGVRGVVGQLLREFVEGVKCYLLRVFLCVECGRGYESRAFVHVVCVFQWELCCVEGVVHLGRGRIRLLFHRHFRD